MGDHDTICNTELSLGIGLGISLPKSSQERSKDHLPLNLSFRLGASGSRMAGGTNKRSTRTNYQDENNNNDEDRPNMKLLLSKEQMSVLESKFKKQSKISNTEKNELAAMLDITPRQVEVWFQNRRSRTKMNQMEIDCAEWKKLCEQLIQENRQLKKEVQELRRLMGYRRQHYLQ